MSWTNGIRLIFSKGYSNSSMKDHIIRKIPKCIKGRCGRLYRVDEIVAGHGKQICLLCSC